MNNFLNTNICLTLVTIRKIETFVARRDFYFFGIMKDEPEGKIIGEFVGLKSKMHSMKNIDGKEPNTAKGVNIATEFNELKDTLFNNKINSHKMRKIQSKKHKMGTYKIDKIPLSVFDEKRFVLDDQIYTLPYFHKDFKKTNSDR